MKGHGSKFGRKMEAAINALMSNRNVEDAAESIGISTQTLRRWMKEPDFQKAFREARWSVFSETSVRLQQACGAAVSTLCRIMVDANTPAAVRTRAAFYILTLGTQSLVMDDIEARLTRLEHSAPGVTLPEAA